MHGVSSNRLSRRDVDRPFHGVVAAREAIGVTERARAYLLRMQPGAFFTGPTAAALHGLPVPRRFDEQPLHVAAFHPDDAPTGRGIVPHRLRTIVPIVEVRGFRMVEAAEAWCRCAPDLSRVELVRMGDALLMGEPQAAAALHAALPDVVARTRRAGIGRLRAVLPLLCAGVRSPAESELRLLVHDAGLPEPTVNAVVRDADGGRLGESDLVWRAQRVVAEYEGDHHRLDRDTFRSDIARRERYEDAGWGFIRVTARDLLPERRDELVHRIRTRLERPAR